MGLVSRDCTFYAQPDSISTIGMLSASRWVLDYFINNKMILHLSCIPSAWIDWFSNKCICCSQEAVLEPRTIKSHYTVNVDTSGSCAPVETRVRLKIARQNAMAPPTDGRIARSQSAVLLGNVWNKRNMERSTSAFNDTKLYEGD